MPLLPLKRTVLGVFKPTEKEFLNYYMSPLCLSHLRIQKLATIMRQTAHKEGSTLKDAAALKLGVLSSEEFDQLVVPENMIGPSD